MGATDAGAPAAPTDDADPWAAVIAANTREDDVNADGTRVPLELAIVQCEAVYGAGWYYAPRRWPTADGFVPFRLMWVYWRARRSADALAALATARGISLAFGDGETGERAARATALEALGG